ncbi:MAG: hypothetical protein AB1446_05175 [Bacillota bacterium]
MPARREHLKAAKVLLGYCDPLVHRLMDQAPDRLGLRHRYVTHNAEYLSALEKLLGREARLEATLHLLQDWRVVVEEDYRFGGPRLPGARRQGASAGPGG